MVAKQLGRWAFWGGVLLLVGCYEGPTPTPIPTHLPAIITTPTAVSRIETRPALATEAQTPALRPQTAVSGTAVPPSSTPEPALLPSMTPGPTAFSPLDLQATVLARSPNPFTSLALEGSLALIGHGTRLVIVDTTNPGQPEFVGELEVANRIKKIQAAGSTVYLVLELPNPVETKITFHTVNITDPAHPFLQDSYIPDFLAVDAVIIGEAAYIVGFPSHMDGINISDPANLFKASTIREVVAWDCHGGGTNVYSVKEAMGYLHLFQGSCRHGGRYVDIMDISDPLNPEVIGRISYPYSVRTMDVVYQENYAFTEIGGFIRVFDISGWQSPALLSDLVFPNQDFPRTNGKLIMVDGYVYYSSAAGLEIIEQTERFQTSLLNSLYPALYLSDITAENGYVYLLSWEDGLLILDAADPANPVEIGRWPG